MGNKPIKLAIDGKKISRGKGKSIGDVNCWGFESKPTLGERMSVYNSETAVVENLKLTINTLEESGNLSFQT